MRILPRFSASIWGGALVVLAAALLYLFTLDNGLRPDELVGGDLITHQYAQVEARPSNAPGYPLYTVGGWLWFRLGRLLLGWALNPIQILSAYSALWGVAALAMLYLVLQKICRHHWPIAALLTAFHATTFFFWYYSVTTEQYSSAVFQTLLLIWLAFRWDDSPRDGLLLAMAFVSGTMLANMVTTLFILPPLLWFIFFRNTDSNRLMLSRYLSRPWLIVQAIVAGLLPLLSYAYIYIRGAQHPEWRGAGQWASAWDWFIQFITIQQGRDELAPGLTLQNIVTSEFPALMWQELTWPLFFGGLLGLALLGRRRAIFLYSTLVIYFVFCWGYRFGNWFQVIIPAYPIFTIGFAALLTKFLAMTQPRPSQKPAMTINPRLALGLILTGLTGLLLYRGLTNFPKANQLNRPGDTGLAPGWAIIADRPALPARIAASFEERVALQYLATVWQAAPGLSPIEVSQLAEQPDAGNLYLSRQGLAEAPQVLDALPRTPQAAGVQLIALETGPQTRLPTSAAPVDLKFGPAIRLVGWEIINEQQTGIPSETSETGLSPWRLLLYWQSSQIIDVDYTISVRPLHNGQLITGSNGQPLIQDHQPVWGAYPTSRWQAGQIVHDLYALPLPPGITPQAVQIIIYRATENGFENLAEQTVQF